MFWGRANVNLWNLTSVPGGIDFRRWAGPFDNDAVREWKAGGGRVVGFFCANAPEEVLWAAGILPLRMRGTASEDTSTADQYFGPVNCGFVRHTLNRVASGELAFLDGLLLTNSCDHLRRLSDICIDKQLAPFCHYIDVPHVNSESSLARLVAQLRTLKERLESAFGGTVSDEKLADALKLYNRTRRLLSRASRLRADHPPRLTGSEVLAMSVASSSMPKYQFNALRSRWKYQTMPGVDFPFRCCMRVMGQSPRQFRQRITIC